MKKTLFLAICLLIAGSVSAQQYFYGPRSDYYSNLDGSFQPRFGIEAGLDVSNTMSGPNSNFNTGSTTGFNAGVTFDLPVISHFSIESEAIYSQKGYAATTVNGNFTQRSQFIDVPVLGKFRVSPLVSLYVGPQLSVLASLKNSYATGFVSSTQSYYDNNSTRTYFDGVIGASVSVTNNIELRARYTVDLQQNNSNGDTYVPGYSNQVFQFGVGYKF